MRFLPSILALFFLIVGCSKTSPEEYTRLAQEAEHAKDYAKAAALYTKLVQDHPGSPQSGIALFSIAQIHAEQTRDFPAAIGAYKQYLQQFPDGKDAPLCLFMAGYLYNNELRELDSAAHMFRQFLERFPDHELALSAKFELDNLGKSPEELLKASAEHRVAEQPKTAPVKSRN
jgi:TolA-binding protein